MENVYTQTDRRFNIQSRTGRKLVSGQCSHTISVSSSDILPRPPGKLGHPFPHPALLYIGEKKLLQKCECFV